MAGPNGLRITRALICALAALFLSQPAFAASEDQILAMCRELMHPQMQACIQAKGLQGQPDAIRQQCGMAIVRPCVLREEQKQAAGVAPPAPPKDDSSVAPAGAAPVQPTFVAPPRTIADITAILDSEKPDQEKIAARKAAADAAPPSNASPTKLAQFYYDRGNARALLARSSEALADGLQALSVAKGGVEVRQLIRIEQFVGLEYRALGDARNSIATLNLIVRDADEPGRRGSLISALSGIARILVSMGDVNQASTYAGRIEERVQEARGSPNANWRAAYAVYGHSWESEADGARGMVFEARGQYAEAEAAYRRAEAFRRAFIKDLPKVEFPPPPEQVILASDLVLLEIAHNEARQGRLNEAEADARHALLEVLKTQGKYSPSTPSFIIGLAGILVEQGRYQEAETLAYTGLDVQRQVGIEDSSPQSVNILSGLGNILIAERKTKEAAAVYTQFDKAIAQWTPEQREAFELNGSRIAALYATGQVDAGIAAAEALVKRQIARTGANSYDAATAHGTLALGYARAGRDTDAVREFKTALPVLIAATHETDDDDPTLVAARSARLQRIVESYIATLARATSGTNDVAVETFALADAVRGHAVGQALAEASARMAATDPALADLVRREQDATKEISAQLGALNNLLSLPSDQRDDQTVRGINAELDKLRADRNAAQQEIKRRFPSYADLVDPKPPSVDEIKAALRPGEALLSFYFGQDASFVWAVPKDGAVAFAAVAATAIDIEARFASFVRRWNRRLRRSMIFRLSICRLPMSSIHCCSNRSSRAGKMRRA